MREGTRRRVLELAAGGSLPLSRFGRAVRDELQPLFAAGVLTIVRAGGGEAVRVENPDALAAFIATHFPEADATGSPSRASAARRMRNTKQAGPRETALLLLRAWRPLMCTFDDQPCDAVALTRAFGAVALVLAPGRRLVLRGTVALIENMECFLHAERMGLTADAALYTAGRLSAMVLNDLAGDACRPCRFVHAPDYDPVGLGEFLRYKRVLGDRVTLHIPVNLRALLHAYGKRALLQGRNAALMQTLRRTAPPELHDILTWMDESNAGLEQEVLIGMR